MAVGESHLAVKSVSGRASFACPPWSMNHQTAIISLSNKKKVAPHLSVDSPHPPGGEEMPFPPFAAGKSKTMSNQHPNDPLHGVTLEMILTHLVEQYGWQELSQRIKIRCFYNEPSVKSSLKFLRRTPWARKEVEDLYLRSLKEKGKANTNDA